MSLCGLCGAFWAFLFLTSMQFATNIVQQRDRLSKCAAKRSANQWFVALHGALHCRPSKDQSCIVHDDCPNLVPLTFLASTVDQETIYKLLLDGLVWNHYLKASCEAIEPFLTRAVYLIKSNDLLFSKMKTNPRKTRSPFQRLYWWTSSAELRQAFADVAYEGNWVEHPIQQMERSTAIHHQQILQKIKQNPSENHRITVEQDPLFDTLEWTSSHLSELINGHASLLDLEIAMTFFQLILDIRPYVTAQYAMSRFNAEEYYHQTVQQITALTMVNLKLAMKAADIVLDAAPDLMFILLDDRKMYRKYWDPLYAHDLKLHPSEVLLNLIDYVSTLAESDSEIALLLLIPCSRYFQYSFRNIEQQRAIRGGKCGSLYYFHFQLLHSMFRFCSAYNIRDDNWVHVAEMVRCAAKLIPFEIEVGDSVHSLVTRTYYEMLDKFCSYHIRNLHVPVTRISI